MIEVKLFNSTYRKSINPHIIATVEETRPEGHKRFLTEIQLVNENLIQVSNSYDEVMNMIKNQNVLTEEKPA